jgi:hypothetical protein
VKYIIEELDESTGFAHKVCSFAVDGSQESRGRWPFTRDYIRFSAIEIADARQATYETALDRQGNCRIIEISEYGNARVVWTHSRGWLEYIHPEDQIFELL